MFMESAWNSFAPSFEHKVKKQTLTVEDLRLLEIEYFCKNV